MRTDIITYALLVVCSQPCYSADVPKSFRSLLDSHCVSCHGPELAERKLRLDTLAAKFDDADNLKKWIRVFDKIARNEMPPAKEPRVPKTELTTAMTDLRQTLHEASLAKQKQEGRAQIRRLNKTEYQNTLRDITGLPIDIGEMLPDDSIIGGFDNIGRGLDLSAEHLLRYQDVAEKVVVSVIPKKPTSPITVRRTGRDITKGMPTFKDILDKQVRLNGDQLVMHVQTYGHIPCASAPAPQAGTYRVRVSVSAINTDGRVLPVLVSCRDVYGREDTDVRGVFDVPFGKPRIIEGEFTMKARENIVLTGWTLPTGREFAKLKNTTPLEKFSGPGLVVDWIEITGPIDPWPTTGYQTFFGDVPLKAESVARAEAAGQRPPDISKRGPDGWIYDPLVMAPARPREDAERLIRRFVPLAFRRPVPKEAQDRFVKIAHDALDRKESFRDSMILAYKSILCSPQFLFLTAGAGLADQPESFDDFALASRLSYFLWSSLPDQELMSIAEKKELHKPAVLRQQTERLLASPKASRFRDNFAGQWLDLRNINATTPDPQLYEEFDPFLFWSMPKETELFFDEVLKHDLPLTEFVHSDWSMLNERLAQHYGIPGVVGGEFRRVSLPKEAQRGGVLTQASILKVTADGTKTSPVLRGNWVLNRMIGLPQDPPPPDVPSIEPDIRGATTIREQLNNHRNTPVCASCHKHIDPPGFALESFDAIGGKRDFYRTLGARREKMVDQSNYPGKKVYRGPDVELGGVLHDGRPFKKIDDYKALLLSDKDQLARNLAEKLAIYATGTEIQFGDREAIENLVKQSRAQNDGFRSLLHAVVQSRLFVNR